MASGLDSSEDTDITLLRGPMNSGYKVSILSSEGLTHSIMVRMNSSASIMFIEIFRSDPRMQGTVWTGSEVKRNLMNSSRFNRSASSLFIRRLWLLVLILMRLITDMIDPFPDSLIFYQSITNLDLVIPVPISLIILAVLKLDWTKLPLRELTKSDAMYIGCNTSPTEFFLWEVARYAYWSHPSLRNLSSFREEWYRLGVDDEFN